MQNTTTNRFLKEVPFNYARCIIQSCPLADRCLRGILWRNHVEDKAVLPVVNPALVSQSADCGYYADSEPSLYATGFRGMQEHMLPRQYESFMRTCRARFGRNGYYLRRRGDLPMPPAEQQFVRSVLKQIGVSDDICFDGYEQRVNWRAK